MTPECTACARATRNRSPLRRGVFAGDPVAMGGCGRRRVETTYGWAGDGRAAGSLRGAGRCRGRGRCACEDDVRAAAADKCFSVVLRCRTTWSAYRAFVDAIDSIGSVPLTLLVVQFPPSGFDRRRRGFRCDGCAMSAATNSCCTASIMPMRRRPLRPRCVHASHLRTKANSGGRCGNRAQTRR